MIDFKKIKELAVSNKDKGQEGIKPYIEIGDIDINNKNYTIKDKLSVSKPIIGKKGNIIISRVRPTRGAISILNDDILVSNAFTVLESTEEVHSKFLFYFLAFNGNFFKYLETRQVGSSYPSCRERDIMEFKIPYFPINTQKKIAAILDKAQALIDLDKQIIQKYDQLAQSVFLEMFGDPVRNDKQFSKCNLKDEVIKIQIGPFGSQLHKEDYVSGGIPLINPKNIINGNIAAEKNLTISIDKYNSLPNYHLREGDIIMARRGEMGRCAPVFREQDGFFCGTGSLYIRPKKTINSIFLYFLLSSKGVIDYLENNAKGITMKNLNKSIIENITFGLPDILLQHQFIEQLNSLEKQKKIADHSLKRNEELFQSLLQKAFKGELV